jgi:hypothetical protein
MMDRSASSVLKIPHRANYLASLSRSQEACGTLACRTARFPAAFETAYYGRAQPRRRSRLLERLRERRDGHVDLWVSMRSIRAGLARMAG